MVTAATQKRWLTAPKSKLTAANIITTLRQDEAWILLPAETRQRLYDLLPAPQAGEAPYDIDVHPLQTRCKPYIEEEARAWQEDLREGREVKKWREAALAAGRERDEGTWDEWKEAEREEIWGKGDENSKPEPESKGEESVKGGEVAEAEEEGEVVVPAAKEGGGEAVVSATKEDESEAILAAKED